MEHKKLKTKVKFYKEFYKHWFVFPLCIEWETKLVEYYVPFAKRLSIHFLWWHLAWTFFKGEKENGKRNNN